MNVTLAKQAARQAARTRRAASHRALPPGQAGRAIAAHFMAEPRLVASARPGTVAAGYFPMADEADCLPLLHELSRLGLTIALPVVIAARHPLVFRTWDPAAGAADLVPGPYGVKQPPATAPQCSPSLILVPLLAFDRGGFRLGYGGGYYDRTLATAGRVTAVGIAYAAQRVDAVPHDATDVALDWVVTDSATHLCGSV